MLITRGSLVRAQPDPPSLLSQSRAVFDLVCWLTKSAQPGGCVWQVVVLWIEFWGFSSAGRAPALQAGGRRFDPVNLHQKKQM